MVGVMVSAMLGCEATTVGRVRYKNQSIVWRVNDRRDVPKRPKKRSFRKAEDVADRFLFRRTTHAMELSTPRRALDINALGEVPDSTWFTNRIGVRELGTDEIARGPNSDDGPDLSQPLRVKTSKTGGTAAGFVGLDASGQAYLIKFEQDDVPIIETATDIVVQRLLWACGYNVPENHVVFLTRDQIEVTEQSVKKGKLGKKSRMTESDLDRLLAGAGRESDGSYRALASKYLAGAPIGGFKDEGVRRDDPNDTIAHEHRRSVRGLYAIFSWLQYTDVKDANTLDMWVEDPRHEGRHYVMHYLVDFGKSLGAFTVLSKKPADGHAYNVDLKTDLLSLFAFGLWKRPWEGTHNPGIEGVGAFDTEHFDPGTWKPHWPSITFAHKDDFDMFWASKIIIRFTPEQIRAAVEQGKFTDPDAIDYLTEVLVGRQRKLARYWFARVNPLDRFRIQGDDVRWDICFDDLLVDYELDDDAAHETKYHAAAYDFDGKRIGWSVQTREPCVGGFHPPKDHDGYTIIRIKTVRKNDTSPPVEVHVARDPESGELRIIGINRR